MPLSTGDLEERLTRWRFDIIGLSLVLGISAFVDSQLVERFARAGVDLVADWIIAAAESVPVISRVIPPRSATAVVMITEKDAPDVAEQWPLPLSAYTRFIQRASCLGAGGVFLDIGIPGKPRSDDSITDAALQTQHNNEIKAFRTALQTRVECPSWSAREPTDPRDMPVLIPEQYDPTLRHIASPAEGLRYVSAFVEPDNIVYAVEAGATPQDEPRSTASCELAQIVIAYRYRNSIEKFVCPSAIQIRDTSMTPSEQTEFSQPAFGASDCLYRRGMFGAFRQPMAFGLAFPFHLLGPRDDWETCPPVLTIPWEAMFDPGRAEQLKRVLKGRVLLVSAAIPGISDRSQTELHSDLPGVYLHALAVEALTSAFGAAQPALWWERLILLVLASLAVSIARYGIYLPTIGESWFGIRQSRVTTLQAPDGSREVSRTETSLEVREEVQSADRAGSGEQTVTETKRHRPVAAAVVVLGVIYSLMGWKLRVLGLDLLFFWICHMDDIWWLDPARIFSKLIEGLRDRLNDGYHTVNVNTTGADR